MREPCTSCGNQKAPDSIDIKRRQHTLLPPFRGYKLHRMAHAHHADTWSKHSDKWASSVQEITAAPCRELLSMMLELSPPIHDAPRFFDNGAGSGMFTSTILKVKPKAQITAADLSSGMIDTLKKEGQKQGWTTVKTLVADASDLQAAGLKDESFTFSAGTFFLPFVSDPAKVIAEMTRVAEPGGVVAVSTWSRVSWVPLWQEAVRETLDSSYTAPALFHTGTTEREDIEKLFIQAGLQNVTAKPFDCWQPHKESAETATAQFYSMGNPSIQLLHKGFTAEQIEQTRPAFTKAYTKMYNGVEVRRKEVAILAVGQKPQ